MEQFYAHPIETVWKAITDGKEISSWFLQADFKPEVGYNYRFTSPDEKCHPIVGEVKAASPYTLTYTWIEEGVDVETTVNWTLTTTDKGTTVKLTHSGVANYEGAKAVEMFDSFSGGWKNCLSSLSQHLQAPVHAG